MRAICHICPTIALKTNVGIIGNVSFQVDFGINDDGSVTFFDGVPQSSVPYSDDGSTPTSATYGTAKSLGGRDDGGTSRGHERYRRRHHRSPAQAIKPAGQDP
jgi:hypothetical protein